MLLLRKKARYRGSVLELENRYDKAHFVNQSMDAFGTMGSSSSSFLDMLKDLNIDERACSFIVNLQNILSAQHINLLL